MELQKHKKSSVRMSKTRKFKAINNNTTKFVGVRQRPSGRWVAEIKDTTQKIRMWLGTFETAEEAAKAYDEAACLLRGSNTRTNFVTHVSFDSPLASRIRNLLNSKKAPNKQQQHHTEIEEEEPVEVSTPSNSSNMISYTPSNETFNETQVFDDVYKPDMTNCGEGREMRNYREELTFGSSKHDLSWDFGPGFDRLLDYSLPETSSGMEFTEFDRMKVERQISASLYAINGVQEYMDTVHEALWDLPPIY